MRRPAGGAKIEVMAVPGLWRHSRSNETVLITDAHPSMADERSYRTWRYAITMGIRLACLLLAVLLRGTPWVWGAIVGAVILPWTAVLMANDRLPRGHGRVAWHDGAPHPERALESADPARPVVEHEPSDVDRQAGNGHHEGL